MDKNILITITGANNYFGKKPFKVGRVLKLTKEPYNDFDCEAIKAILPYIGTVGYVANSIHTVYEGTYSAGRLYDKFEDCAYAEIIVITHSSVIAKVLPDDEVTDKF